MAVRALLRWRCFNTKIVLKRAKKVSFIREISSSQIQKANNAKNAKIHAHDQALMSDIEIPWPKEVEELRNAQNRIEKNQKQPKIYKEDTQIVGSSEAKNIQNIREKVKAGKQLNHAEKMIAEYVEPTLTLQKKQTQLPINMEEELEENLITRDELDAMDRIIAEMTSKNGEMQENQMSSEDARKQIKKQLLSLPTEPALFFKDRPRSLRNWQILLRAYEVRGMYDEAQEIRAVIEGMGYSLDAILYQTFLSIAATNARNMDTVTKLQRADEVLRLYNEMKGLGLVPKDETSTDTHRKVLHSLVKLGQTKKAYEMLDEWRADGYLLDESMFTVLIRGSLIEKNIDQAWATYHRIRSDGAVPDVLTYNLMIKACGMAGETEKALKLFKFMIDSDEEPNVDSYVQAIHACASRPDHYVTAFELYEQAIKDGIKLNEDLMVQLLHVSALQGDITNASLLFKEMLRLDITRTEQSYAAMLVAISQSVKQAHVLFNGRQVDRSFRFQMADSLVEQMNLTGLPITQRICSEWSRVYCMSGHIKTAEQKIIDIHKRYNLQPSYETYYAMLKMYGYCRRPEKAISVLQTMLDNNFKPEFKAWNLALDACRKSKNSELGALTLSRMRAAGFEPDPKLAELFDDSLFALRFHDAHDKQLPPKAWDRSRDALLRPYKSRKGAGRKLVPSALVEKKPLPYRERKKLARVIYDYDRRKQHGY